MIFEIVLGITGGLFLISIILLCMIYLQKNTHDRMQKRIKDVRQYVFDYYMDHQVDKKKLQTKFFFDVLIDIDEQIHLDPEIRKQMIQDIESTRFIKGMYRKLHSPSIFKRRMAIFYIARLRTEDAYDRLFNRFIVEKNESIRIRIVSHMRYGMNDMYLHHIMASFVGATDIYQERLAVLLASNYKRIFDLCFHYENDERIEIKQALVMMGSFHLDGFLVKYMKAQLKHLLERELLSARELTLKQMILDNLVQFVPDDVMKELTVYEYDPLVHDAIIKAFSYQPSVSYVRQLIRRIYGTEYDQTITESLSQLVFQEQSLLDEILLLYPNLNDHQKHALYPIFNAHIDYVVLKLFDTQKESLNAIIISLLSRHMTEALIDFLNQNRNSDYQAFLLEVIHTFLRKDGRLKEEFEIYLNETLLKKLGLKKKKQPTTSRERSPIEKTKVRWMLKWIILSFLLYPLIYIGTHIKDLFTLRLIDILTGFIVSVNIYTVFYFTTLNVIYLLLLIFAAIGSKRQLELSRSRKSTLLFSHRLLPGISIIAPAYNEELSIVESVTSLLNLKYPNYEVVVINDGSKDQTLQVMLTHFNMVRRHDTREQALETKRVRGVYRSKTIPNLVVIDKENGGKADALNVGINASKMPYVCGIDADSILEPDALLKLSASMLDDTKPYIALGGNIYPANGFHFDKGKAEEKHIPKETICRFQSIEYLRAFTSGRMGWSMLNSLMIISGAFGLFKKDLLIETGGYLTSSSKHKKDTVGEDMELVVRLTREALERKKAYRVQYVYNAFCYTELPSDLKTLLKQRNRWQRGLIDILSYHRKIGFNLNYKQVGTIGYPYFFIYEFLGPFFEIQGYIMLTIGIIFGLLTPAIILSIFSLSILFGMVISLTSILITEKEWNMMSKKDTMTLTLYAILENFFYRQLISIHRVLSSLTAIRETGSWGAQKRKGFKQKT